MFKPESLVTAFVVFLAAAVAATAALNLVVGQRYTLTGTMTQCHEHPGTFFINVPAAGGGSGGGGSHSARAAGSDSSHGDVLMLQSGAPTVNLGAVFQSLHAGQKITATGLYMGLVDSGHGEKHATLKAEQLSAVPAPREANFRTIYDLRRE